MIRDQKQQPNYIICTVNGESDNPDHISIDSRITKFDVAILESENPNPYPIPECIITSPQSLVFMNQFCVAHRFDPSSLKVRKPMSSRKVADLLDPISFAQVQSTHANHQEFTNLENLNEGVQIVKLAHFLQFWGLLDAVGLSIVSNFWEDKTDNQLLPQVLDVMIEHEKLIMMSESFEKEDIYNQHLRKFCEDSSFQFESAS